MPATITLVQQPLTPAVADLLEGRLDAIVLASAPESLMVQMLLQTPGVQLFDFAQADAYTRRFGFLTAVTLPRGVVDLARDLPAADVHMVAPTATLVARDNLHPALAQLFVQAAPAGARRARLVPAQGRLSQCPRRRTRTRMPRPSVSIAAACPGCSATCRSGWPT